HHLEFVLRGHGRLQHHAIKKQKPRTWRGFVSNLGPFESNGLFRLGVAAVRVGSARPPRPGCSLGVSGN
ncbi:hypothetical protein, partial [Burkholderia pseudomallei]